MRIGYEYDFQRAVALCQYFASSVGQFLCAEATIDRIRLAEAEMGIDLDAVAYPAAEQAPDRQAERFPKNIPERQLDAGDGGRADDAQSPEAQLVEAADDGFDIARITADDERSQVLDRADDGARLPFERRLAPTVEAR